MSNAATNFVMVIPRENLRVHFSYAVSPKFSFRSRVDLLWYDKENVAAEKGLLIYTEGNVKCNSKLSGNLRLQYFGTDGYNSRIYTYESDVLYSYSVPAFFDKGFRYYSNLHYDWTKRFSSSIRWAQTLYKNKETVGSALDEIDGNKRSEVKLQLQYYF
jgi:hypothetical protein